MDRPPFLLRDHLQDSYLEALGWYFVRPPAFRVSISADDADTFAHTSEVHFEESDNGLSALLRQFLVGS